jgi:DNA-binding IclR family transcriptional regulator
VANSPSGESIIQRVVKIIGAFDDSHASLSVSAIARRAGLPVTTTYRLVNDLQAERLLERAEDGDVQLGFRLWELASRGSRVLGLREAALPFLEDVRDLLNHHVTLGVLDKDEVLYIERLTTRSSTVDITRIAGRLPIHGSSSGLVLLAHSPAEYQDYILAKKLPKFTEDTVTEPAELRRYLAEIRQIGYVSMRGIIVPESSGIAVPVFGGAQRVAAALSVIVPRHQENLPAIIPVLKTAARGITRAMGGGTAEPAVRR